MRRINGWVLAVIVFLGLYLLREIHLLNIQDTVLLIDIALLIGLSGWYFSRDAKEKKELLPWIRKSYMIGIVCFLMFLFLKAVNVFQVENGLGSISAIFFFTIVATVSITYIEKRSIAHHEKGILYYDNLDLLRYISSIIIIVLHLRPFLGVSDGLDLAFNNIVSRTCVPIFFLITGYFVAKKEVDNPGYINQYIKSMLPFYLFWSFLYIPVLLIWARDYFDIAWQFVGSLSISPYLLGLLSIFFIPIVLIIALIYTGTFYHLWYFPALFLSLIVLKKWKEKFSYKILLGISFVLLLFGATETYFGMLPSSFQSLLSYYFKIFFTTRNFLFFGLFYVVLGYHVGKKKDPFRSYSFLKLLLSVYLLVIEGILLQLTHRLNSNILLSCVPLVYYLFLSLLYIGPLCSHALARKLRNLSKYYYLLHPMVIVLLDLCFPLFFKEYTIIKLIALLVITHLLSTLILRLKKRYPKWIL